MDIIDLPRDEMPCEDKSEFHEGRKPMIRGVRRLASVDSAEKSPPSIEKLHLWAESEPMMRLIEMVDRVAPTRATVLLVGESGTGKEVVAQRLHAESANPDKPFIALNCSAVPAGLIEAELFGHERGSFTGAVRSSKGVFERAADGTLFLDEVTEMPLDMQSKLLRVVETGRYIRVGGDDEMTASCRIVAATNRHPEQAVEEGTLRADLLYRLAEFPLRLPALRERGADIELIANRYIAQLNTEYGADKRLSDYSRRFLHEHSWPGNVRELKNSIHRGYIMADREVDLEVFEGCVARCNAEADQVAVPIGTSIADMERELIRRTLSRCDGNKRQAARILGISLKTLYNRLNDYERFERVSA